MWFFYSIFHFFFNCKLFGIHYKSKQSDSVYIAFMWIGQKRQIIWTGRIKTQTKRNVSNFVGFKLRRTIVESTARTFLRSWYGNHTLRITSVKTAVIRIVNQMINDNMENCLGQFNKNASVGNLNQTSTSVGKKKPTKLCVNFFH